MFLLLNRESGMESNEATHQKEPLGLSPVPILVEQTFNDSIKKVKKKNLVELTRKWFYNPILRNIKEMFFFSGSVSTLCVHRIHKLTNL